MPNTVSYAAGVPEPGGLAAAAALLGGPGVLKSEPSSPLEVHRLLQGGLPQQALDYLVHHVNVVKGGRHFEDAFGMTYRTYQRRRTPGGEPLSLEQSSKTWNFVRVLARATELLGNQDEAERWISAPVMGLGGQVPLDLLQTPAGLELVNNFLTRLEYGVYT